MLDLVEVEEEQDSRHPRRPAEQQVRQDQPRHGRPGHQGGDLRDGRRTAARRVHRLADLPDGEGDGQGQKGDHEPAHGLHAGRLVAMQAELDDRRQHQHQDHARHIARLPPAVDARALVVVRRQGGGPGLLRQRPHREADIDHEQRRPQPGDAGAGPRHEQHERARHQHRRAQHQPQPEPPEPRARGVHRRAEQRVEPDVEQPHEGEGHAHARQRQTDAPGVIGRQMHHQRQPDRRQRQARPAERQKRRLARNGRLAHPARVAGFEARRESAEGGGRRAVPQDQEPPRQPKAITSPDPFMALMTCGPKPKTRNGWRPRSRSRPIS